MNFTLKHDRSGQAGMVGVALTLIITLVIGIVVVNQLFLAGIGPTDNQGSWENADNHSQGTGWTANPNYDADALAAYHNLQTLSWAGIGLMALAIIVLAAATILGIVRSGLGGVGNI